MRTPRSRLALARVCVCVCFFFFLGGMGGGVRGGGREGVVGVAAERGFDHFL